jgi:NADPH2:quinone reductase
MKAFALISPDKPAGLVELPDPGVSAGAVRVRVRAASVNGFDVFQANGYLFAVMEHQFPTIIGRDFAGIVDAVGEGRTDFAVGDAVFGFVSSTPPLHDGTYAELLSGGRELVLAAKPAGLSFEVAAALTLVGATALDAVDAIEVGPGDTVLVVGATGGVGSIVVQLAAQRGASVIATAKAGTHDAFVRALGAADTVDYAVGDVAESVRGRYPAGIDALIDLVDRGGAFTGMAKLVRDGGHIASSMGAADVEGLAARGIRATNLMGSPTSEKLASLAAQVAARTLRVEVQQTFPLADAPAAFAVFTAGTRGNSCLRSGRSGLADSKTHGVVAWEWPTRRRGRSAWTRSATAPGLSKPLRRPSRSTGSMSRSRTSRVVPA